MNPKREMTDETEIVYLVIRRKRAKPVEERSITKLDILAGDEAP